MNRKLVDYKVSYGYFQIFTSGSGDEKAVAFLLAMAWLSTAEPKLRLALLPAWHKFVSSIATLKKNATRHFFF